MSVVPSTVTPVPSVVRKVVPAWAPPYKPEPRSELHIFDSDALPTVRESAPVPAWCKYIDVVAIGGGGSHGAGEWATLRVDLAELPSVDTIGVRVGSPDMRPLGVFNYLSEFSAFASTDPDNPAAYLKTAEPNRNDPRMAPEPLVVEFHGIVADSEGFYGGYSGSFGGGRHGRIWVMFSD